MSAGWGALLLLPAGLAVVRALLIAAAAGLAIVFAARYRAGAGRVAGIVGGCAVGLGAVLESWALITASGRSGLPHTDPLVVLAAAVPCIIEGIGVLCIGLAAVSPARQRGAPWAAKR
ncbi:hypothetical protein GSY69_11620 [Brevibacterium sp. 5221]|uniref:Uncharacterized protein n=1 Tax=Brevibacterium rongguiense TaxID=2695267 RepID=A0A6N9H9Z6_9MICO|nr:hypothetical protein [Brevibacterium rongguiense]MYM20591.1 hypothetical protein [Brevibacterium rongguiense]